jgi:hypothetical protein
MIPAARAQAAILAGLSAVCARCEHYWAALDRGGEPRGCGPYADCGGPARGRSFPQYRGPLGSDLERWCFVCGADATLGCELGAGADRGRVGCCASHERLLRQVLARVPGVVVRERAWMGGVEGRVHRI